MHSVLLTLYFIQKSATVFDGDSKSNLGKDFTNDQAIITPVNKGGSDVAILIC